MIEYEFLFGLTGEEVQTLLSSRTNCNIQAIGKDEEGFWILLFTMQDTFPSPFMEQPIPEDEPTDPEEPVEDEPTDPEEPVGEEPTDPEEPVDEEPTDPEEPVDEEPTEGNGEEGSPSGS